MIGSGKFELRWKLQQDIFRLQVGVDDLALAVQKVQRHGNVTDHVFHHLDRYTSVVVRLDDTEQIAPQHAERHAHVPSVRAVVKEGVRKRRNALGMRYVRHHRNLVRILGAKVGIHLRLASFAFRNDAVQKFNLVHRRFGVMLGRLLHLDRQELVDQIGCRCLRLAHKVAILDHPHRREVSPTKFFDDDVSLVVHLSDLDGVVPPRLVPIFSFVLVIGIILGRLTTTVRLMFVAAILFLVITPATIVTVAQPSFATADIINVVIIAVVAAVVVVIIISSGPAVLVASSVLAATATLERGNVTTTTTTSDLPRLTSKHIGDAVVGPPTLGTVDVQVLQPIQVHQHILFLLVLPLVVIVVVKERVGILKHLRGAVGIAVDDGIGNGGEGQHFVAGQA
mmetsp:Transcript_11654/g.33133  ORF Transcript_11654/g.33133 Transcript_11654/m.33133 type:complete len:395 (+) Transcript_11654:3190-4374(+)